MDKAQGAVQRLRQAAQEGLSSDGFGHGRTSPTPSGAAADSCRAWSEVRSRSSWLKRCLGSGHRLGLKGRRNALFEKTRKELFELQ